jgi:hypothetical protein
VKVSIAVGDVSVELRDVDLTTRQIHALLRLCVDAAHYLPKGDTDTSAPIGFTANVERASEYHRPDFDWVDYEERLHP